MDTNLNRRLKDKIGNETMELKTLTQVPGSAIEAMKDINSYNKELGEESEETKEATSSGAAGQYSQPLFSITKKEVEEMMVKKVEATEATSTSSSGQYSTPAFVAKNSKNWRGGKKPLFPGGKFVKVKEKCKKFPYCNQGDINALKLTENKNIIENTIKKIAKKYGVTETFIKDVLNKEYKNHNQTR
jgi:hypothetical protein